MKLVIGGDLVPTKDNQEFFINEEIVNNLDKKIKNVWFKADYRLFNLECVLGDKNTLNPISKNGPNLIAPIDTINGIKELKPELILLANNHIMDYGNNGLESTINILNRNNIKYTGIIDNIEKTLPFSIFEKNDIKVGIYNLCENEFSVATKENKGANGWNSVKVLNEIKRLKENVDFVIVIFHGGKEFYRYPSPKQQYISHLIIDYGADLLIYQHTHCIGCEETYNNKKIVYGQGNFIFHGGKDEFWNSALIVEVEIDKKNIQISYHQIEMNENLINYSDDKSILREFYKRSERIKDKRIIESEYNSYSLKFLNNYLYNLHGMKFFDKLLHKVGFKNYFKNKYSLKSLLAIENIIECEAHRELLLNGIREKQKMDKRFKDRK